MKLKPELLFFIALALLPALFFAEKIDYTAKTIVYDNETKSILLCDSIKIQSNRFSLWGDTILISKPDKMLFGKGSIKLNMDDFDISGDSVAFNYESKRGSIYRAKTKIDKGYLSGERIFTYDENEYFVYNGRFTTCSADTPHYSFYASKMHLYKNDRVIVRPFVLFVKNVPVMAVPFFVLPVATTRKSGFLMPKAGYSSVDGKYIKDISYFYATNDFADMTFSADIYEKRGAAGRYELNVLVKPLLDFSLKTEYINEFSGRKRWSAEGGYSHALPYDIYLKSRIDFISDVSASADYTDTTAVVLNRNAESFLSLSKDFKLYSSSVSFSRNEDFSDKSVRMSVPSYSGYIRKINFLKTRYFFPNGINYSHSHALNNFYFSDSLSDTNSVATSLNNRLDSSYRIFKYFNLNPYTSLNHSFNSGSGVSSVGLSFAASINTQIYGVSKFGLFSYERFRHTLIPDISFSAGRSWLGGSAVSFGDSLVDSKKMTFSLTNLFEAKRGESKEMLLRNSFSIDYNFTSDSFSLISAGFNLFPEKVISMSLSGSANPYTKTYKISYSLSATPDIFNPLSEDRIKLTATNSTEKTDSAVVSDRLNSSVAVKLGENLDFSLSILYDILNKETVSSSIAMNRSMHCWKAAFRVSTYGESFKYDFSLSLVDIPEVSLDKGIFGPLLP
ncbi:MAG: putative LPS assembly protein LptD [bacterium]|nr:putative LPS assembly protein LptD [bacterium]